MEKLRVFVVTLLIFGTVLCMFGRFMPGLFRGERIPTLSGGVLVNASVEVSYYYYQFCDEGTSNCYMKTLQERFDDMKTLFGLRSNAWYIERLGELVIDVISMISNVFGILFLLAMCSNTPRLHALFLAAACLFIISATLQLTNLASVFVEIGTDNTPSDVLFPYSVPLIVIGSVCLLITSVFFHVEVILLLFHNEQSQAVNPDFTNVMNVTQNNDGHERVELRESTKL